MNWFLSVGVEQEELKLVLIKEVIEIYLGLEKLATYSNRKVFLITYVNVRNIKDYQKQLKDNKKSI